MIIRLNLSDHKYTVLFIKALYLFFNIIANILFINNMTPFLIT
jgi:hypothetical protein